VKQIPRIICFVGPDGCGKSTLARIAAEELSRQGLRALVVWSRFNNFLSKPLLALALCTGHNRREVHDGAVFGYHDFQCAPWLSYPFILLQTIDVNLACLTKRIQVEQQADILIFERSPWDTLADIIVDTGCRSLTATVWGRLITVQMRGRGPVFYVNRSKDLIMKTRPELKHDRRLDEKIAAYAELAVACGWAPLDNNRPLAEVTRELAGRLMPKEGIRHG
jgi:hypothetical protein